MSQEELESNLSVGAYARAPQVAPKLGVWEQEWSLSLAFAEQQSAYNYKNRLFS